MEVLVGLVRMVLGGTLIVAGVSKSLDRNRFVRTLQNMAPIPRPLIGLISFLVPTAELALGALVGTGLAYRPASLATAAMIASFTLVVAVQLARGRESECACFGSLTRGRIGAGTLARNLLLLAISFVVYAFGPGSMALGARSGL